MKGLVFLLKFFYADIWYDIYDIISFKIFFMLTSDIYDSIWYGVSK